LEENKKDIETWRTKSTLTLAVPASNGICYTLLDG
jgi:hypothetical protein